MVKTAVIMAAGLGSRFGHYTDLIPKGFVEIGGIPMIIRSIETLLCCGIERIVIGTGYKYDAYEELKTRYPMIETCFSSRYAETNSMYTLFNMRKLIGDDSFILLESDLVFDKKAIISLLNDKHDTILLSTPVTKFQDQYYIETDNKGFLVNCSENKDEINYLGEFVGIHKLSNQFYKQLCKYYESIVSEQPKLGYEYALLYMSNNNNPIYVLNTSDVKWYEIDDVDDLKYAEENVLPFI